MAALHSLLKDKQRPEEQRKKLVFSLLSWMMFKALYLCKSRFKLLQKIMEIQGLLNTLEPNTQSIY